MLRKGIFLAISTTFLVAITVLTVQILCRKDNATAGVVTLKASRDVHYFPSSCAALVVMMLKKKLTQTPRFTVQPD
jgi:hypothetical protein